MAGRRLSSNDVSVLIALAIVVLVLLLVYVAERGEGRVRKPIALKTEDARVAAGPAGPAPIPEASGRDGRDAGNADACGVETMQPGQSESEADAVADRQRDEAVRQLGLLQEQLDPLERRLEMLNELMRDRLQE